MDAFMGTVLAWAPNFAPRNWAYCDGQLLAISSNTALFSLIGTIYGGNGQTTFGLPDLRGRAVIGFGQGPGLSNYAQGTKGGSESVTLNTQQMPAHNHSAQLNSLSVQPVYSTSNAARETPQEGDVPAKVGQSSGPTFNAQRAYGDNSSTVDGATLSGSGSVTIGNTGGNQSHENRQPYQVLSWIICLQGIFPPRN